jgi:phosphohistidine phosphatase SixA
MMRAVLVRHARAGDRAEWAGDDRLRPLDTKGHRQSMLIAATLAELGVTRLVSSPYLRCVQTLEPAAKCLGLEIEGRDELAEGGAAEDVLGLLDELAGSLPALCTHGDVLEALLGDRPCKKGSSWVVTVAGGRVRPERYLAPPA